MSWNVWNRPSGSFMVDMGISSNIMKSPSPKCYMTFWDMTIYNDTLNWSDITPICELIIELDFITDFDLITIFGGFHRTLQRVRLATEDAYSSGHLVLYHLGLAFVLMLRLFFPKIVMSTDLLSFEHPSVLLFCFDKNVYFSFSWTRIIKRLICEIVSGIALEIRFLWNSKHDVYWAGSLIASNVHVMLFSQGQEKIYYSYFVYWHHMYSSVTMWC